MSEQKHQEEMTEEQQHKIDEQDTQKKKQDDKTQKKQIKGMLQRLNQAETKINQNHDQTLENAKKDKEKVKRYEEEISQLEKQYDEYREKDPVVFDSKVKTEVDFAILRISEKRYKAEQEVEHLKEIIAKKNALISNYEVNMKNLKLENEQLKTRVSVLEEEVKDLSNGLPPGARKSKAGLDVTVRTDGLDVRDDLSEHHSVQLEKQLQVQQRQNTYDEEDAFWYQNETPNNGVGQATFGQQNNSGSGHEATLLNKGNDQSQGAPKQLARAPQNRERLEDDMAFYGVGVKTSNNATFKKPVPK